MFLLFPIWKLALKNVYSRVLTLVFIWVLGIWHPDTTLLCLDRAFEYAIWFYTGMLLSYIKIDTPIKVVHGVSMIIVGTLLLIWGFCSIRMVGTIGCIAVSIGIAFLLDRYISSAFKGFRNYTYQIYLMGIFAQIFVKILFRHISMPYLVGWILCVVAGLYVPVLVSKIVEKINWTPLKLCVGLK